MLLTDVPEFAVREWRAFLAELESEQGAPADFDQLGMHQADDEDLTDWVDDLEARLGFNVDRLRPLMLAYISASNEAMREQLAGGAA